MQHLEVSGAVRPLKRSLGVKWLMYTRYNELFTQCAASHHFSYKGILYDMTGLYSMHMWLYCGGYFPTDLHVN